MESDLLLKAHFPSDLETQKTDVLEGFIEVQGAKNSVLKIMAASLLAQGSHVIKRTPLIRDVIDAAGILRFLGAKVSLDSSKSLRIEVSASIGSELPDENVKNIRASVVFLAPVLARAHEIKMFAPGGDDFGLRPIDMHLKALEQMGATFKYKDGVIIGQLPGGRFKATRHVLEYPSHTATDNILMAAATADGITVIENAAREPEVKNLADFLNSLGAKIIGAGTSHVKIEGVSALRPGNYFELIGDRVEAATYLIAPGVIGGRVAVGGIEPFFLDNLLGKLRQIGLLIEVKGDEIIAYGRSHVKAIDIRSLPYPGIASDYLPALVVLLAKSKGACVVTENVFGDGRFKFIGELQKMGADIISDAHHMLIRGVDSLKAAVVNAPDLRAGAALALAGLSAEGNSRILNAQHIFRGYENFCEKLRSIGANVKVVS